MVRFSRLIYSVLFVLMVRFVPTYAQAIPGSRPIGENLRANVTPEMQKGVGIDEKLGSHIPLDVSFRDEAGNIVQIGSFFTGKKPVLLNFAYHTCPMLCHYVLDGIVAGAKRMTWTPGQEYEIVTVSIQPTETPELATRQKAKYMKSLGKKGAETGWHFLTGEEANIRRLANAAGFKYRWDDKTKQFSHAAAIVLAGGDGKISRYLYGIRFDSKDLRNGLIEASEGKVGTTIEKVFLWCYHYDPKEGSYVLSAWKLMQVGAGAVLLIFGGFLFWFWRKERKTPPASVEDILARDSEDHQ